MAFMMGGQVGAVAPAYRCEEGSDVRQSDLLEWEWGLPRDHVPFVRQWEVPLLIDDEFVVQFALMPSFPGELPPPPGRGLSDRQINAAHLLCCRGVGSPWSPSFCNASCSPFFLRGQHVCMER
jgi:hypothetical protein